MSRRSTPQLAILALATLAASARAQTPADTAAPLALRTLTLSETVLSGDRETAMREAARLSESLGGWFQSWSSERMELRIPVDSLPVFEARLPALGRPSQRDLSSQDLSEAYEDAAAGLVARERLLSQWERLLEDSRDPQGALDAQRDIARVAGEIDERRGIIARLRDQAAYARVTLDFRFQGREVSDRGGRTPFPWLNRLDLADLERSFR